MSKLLRRVMMIVSVACTLNTTINAQQLTNANFEDWTGSTFDGEPQPKGWNASNVEQLGIKFNFAHKETGRNGGYCMMVQDQEVGAMGITETSPGYFAIGKPWAYLPSITQISNATAGTSGGQANWHYRPDSMSVWIKRTGTNWAKEDFYLLYYSWVKEAKGTSYKGKNGSCTSHSETNEESDIRIAVDGNECSTTVSGEQVCEGIWRERAQYSNWTNIRVPIYYMNSNVPNYMNIIFSASNYPNYRANTGLYAGNSLYVDDVSLIYSSKIQKLYVDGKEWKGFDPNSSDIQYYSLSESATEVPTMEAFRGAGSITNAKGKTTSFAGRKLSGSEITVTDGNLTDQPTTIVVRAEDGSSTTTYRIQFQKAASSNAKLAGITINGEPLTGFSATKYNYNVDLPYGTTAAPVVDAEKQEDAQTIAITQPASVNGTATIKVTAANNTTSQTYTVNFKVGLLADNELQDIQVDGKSIPGFNPSQTIYKVSLPVGTTVMPTVTAVSKYPQGEQTIVHTAPSVIDGGVYQISVTTPGNQIAKVYKLNFKLEPSSYTYLQNLQVAGGYIANFQPDNFTYYINLPMGTTAIPDITYTAGDEYQTINLSELGAGVLDGTVRVTVTAGNGDQSVYKLVFSTEKSDVSTLAGIQIGGVDLPGFSPEVTSYNYALPVGTTAVPEIVAIPGDEYQKPAVITTAGVNGKTRITVTAGDGSTTIYIISFSVETFSNNTLAGLSVAGFDINFQPEENEYWVNLPQGTTTLPEVTYTLVDPNFQSASVRTISGLSGDYKITIRPQSGASRTYIIHFSVATSSNVNLNMIYVDGTPLADFAAGVTEYEITLPEGVSKIPAVTFDKAETSQRVLSVLDGRVQTITVTAQSGATRTYTLTFIVTVSENAYLDMIYLGADSVPLAGFVPTTLNYEVLLESATCPLITVAKAAGQQVTITAPYGAGVAQIKVQPEQGAANIYQITFTAGAAASVRLAGINIDGTPLAGFAPTTLSYEQTYMGSLPLVEGVLAEVTQTQQVLWKDETASIHISDQEGNKAVYTIHFTRQMQSNKALEAILVDGTALADFDPAVLDYSRTLPAGSTYPEVSYVAAEAAQVVFFGQLAEGKWGITVVAEDGTTSTYTIQFEIDKYDDVTLQNIFLDGVAIAEFAPATLTYAQTIDEGAALPKLTVETKAGQTTFTYNASENQQKVLVIAESGNTNTYTISYTRTESSNALLADILIDGESLLGFQPTQYNYSISLPQGTKVVPNVYPVGQLPNQTITTAFSRPNGVTKIHVVAQDGSASDYTIAFPLTLSGNTLLGELMIDGVSRDVNTTDYEFTLPYGSTEPYAISFEKAEATQSIDYTLAPIDGVSKITVHAENGDFRNYTIRYRVAQPEGANSIRSIAYEYINAVGETVNGTVTPIAGDNIVNLPYGAKSFTVTGVEKNYSEQSVILYNGGIRRGASVVVMSNQDGVADVTYSVRPVMPEFDATGKLSSLKFNGVEVPNFRPDVYNYMVNVTAQPAASDFTYAAYDGKDVVVSALDNTKKQITFAVEDGETYSVCWFYENDGKYQKDGVYYDYLDLSQNWEATPSVAMWKSTWTSSASATSTKMSTGFKPHGWIVPADLVAGLEYDISVFGSHVVDLFWYTGKEAIATGAGAMLSTINGASINGSVPGMMTLGGTMKLTPGKSGNSTSSVTYTTSNFITMRNTPDSLSMRYKSLRASNISQWYFELKTVAGSTRTNKFTGNYSTSGWRYASQAINAYSSPMNSYALTINSCHTANAGDMTGSNTIYSSDLQVEDVHFVYNSDLTDVTVNGTATTKSGNTFTATVADDYLGIPALKFTGKVHDQMQKIEWLNNGEWIDGRLTAKVTNYGENSLDSTVYTVIAQRNPVTDLTYSIDFGSYAFTEGTDTTVIALPYGASAIPNITITPSSIHQRFAITKEGNAVKVTVTAEDNNSSTRVYLFRETKTANAQLADILLAGGAELVPMFVPTTTNYTVSAAILPEIEFMLAENGQTAALARTTDGATISVKASNGVAEQTYTIQLVSTATTTTTTGQITEFTINDDILTYLGGDVYSCEKARPVDAVSFVREDATDSVAFIQTMDKLEWRVYGSEDHIYTWNYPTAASTNANLAAIFVANDTIEGFSPYVTDYTIEPDAWVEVSTEGAEIQQKISTIQVLDEGIVDYTINVTAEDGLTTKTYHVRVVRPKSDDATLAGILLDNVLIDGFDPATESYTAVLPLPADGVKRMQPQMPNVTYIAGHKGQTVTVEPAQLGNPVNFTVVSEDGMATKYYDLTIMAEESRCVDLTGITVNGAALDHFEPGRHYYSISLKTSDIAVDYTSADRFQTVDITSEEVVADREYHYTLHVTAEHGETSDYSVEIYVENQSNDRTLANITLDGKDFVDFERALNEDLTFDPDNNNYTINLPSGTTILPEVNAQLKMDGQTVAIDQQGDSVLLNVTAVDGSTNQYVLHFVVPLSKNANLSMIFLDGEQLPSFDPTYNFYQVDLPVGTHTLPEVVAQKAEVVQTLLPIEIDNEKLQATIKVQAEDPETPENTYVVVFHFTQSDADTLLHIFQDGQPLAGFAPQTKYYTLTLPVGTTAFPDLSWEEADDWQIVKMDTVESSADQLIRQIVVTSESGKKNFYTVSYTIEKSDVDWLQMIFIDQKQLPEFNAYNYEYYYELTASYATELNGQVPIVEYISGDEYQTVLVSQVRDSLESKSLGYKSIITVTAATGATKTYTIHYPVQKSSEATLNMINLGGKPLTNYDAERFNYKVEIDLEASVPVVTVIKKEEIQVVEITINDDVVSVFVTAEDGTQQTYTLIFERIMSSITTLQDIILRDEDGVQFPAAQFPFRYDNFSYTINLPYTAEKALEEQLPSVETVVRDPMQVTDSIHYLLPNGDIQVDITVTAPNGENQAIYSLVFHFMKPTDATLVNILINDNELPGFLSLQTEYMYAHPYGSDSTAFFAAADIEALLSDPLATYTVTENEEGTIFIRVVAQDGNTEITYIIMQSIAKDNDCFLSAILLGDSRDSLRGFDPEETFYTYYLREGSTTTPLIEAIPHSENAEVSIREVAAGDTCMIIVTADDGSEMRYYIHFAIAAISETQEPTANDVVVKRIPGSNQLFVGTIRRNVYFALFDQNGHRLYYNQVPTADPNDAELVNDLVTDTRLNDVIDTRSGLIIDIIPGQIYFYTFLYGDKTIVQMLKGDTAKKLKSGKIICQ